jgi:hypothetical protein
MAYANRTYWFGSGTEKQPILEYIDARLKASWQARACKELTDRIFQAGYVWMLRTPDAKKGLEIEGANWQGAESFNGDLVLVIFASSERRCRYY